MNGDHNRLNQTTIYIFCKHRCDEHEIYTLVKFDFDFYLLFTTYILLPIEYSGH